MKLNIYITKHAIDRFRQRISWMTLKDIKIITNKAYISKDQLPKWFLKSECNLSQFGFTTYYYKYYLKRVFVFQNRDEPKLITVYNRNR